MEKNIKVHIKDRVAVAEGDPVIICGNSDYTVTFIFDEEWGQAFAKTARFKFNTAEGPGHIDQPFTGDTVEVPELSNIREVEVGVFVGDLKTTTGAPVRCKPCVRCGSGAPKDPAPDVYDEIMELINKGGGGGTLDGLPIYVVDALPDDAEVGDIVALNTTSVKPWDQVKVWSRDEAPYKEAGAAAICENLPIEGSFMAGAVPETFDLSGINTRAVIACGLILQGGNGALDISVDNFRTSDSENIFIVIQDHHKNVLYIHNQGVWQASIKGSTPVGISAQDIKLPNLSDVVVLDFFCTMTDDELMEYESFANIEPEPALSILTQLGVLRHKTGLYISEELSDGHRWRRLDENTAKQLSSLRAQNAETDVKASTALTQANNALKQAVNAQNLSDTNLGKINELKESQIANTNQITLFDKHLATVRGAVDTAQVTADAAKIQAETNAAAIAELQEAVNGYSTFLEEINGEVVDDE